MELHRLRSFLAVAELLHFTRAAERLHVSQPALSTHIRRLEADLGIRLFERSHQRTTLTYAGMVYRDEAREILELAGRAVARARLAAEGRIGRLRIGFISTAAAYIIPSLVAEYRQLYPDVELELSHHLTAVQVEMLLGGALDVGFFRLPVLDQPALRIIPVHQEAFSLFLPTGHPLAHAKTLKVADLNGQSFVMYARRNAPGFHEFVLGILKRSNAVPSVMHEANDMYTLVSLVSAGAGVAIAPASLVNYRLPGVTVRKIEGVPPSEIAAACSAEREHAAAEVFLRLTCERMGGPSVSVRKRAPRLRG